MQFVFTLKKKVSVFTIFFILGEDYCFTDSGWIPQFDSHIHKGSGCEMKMEIGRSLSGMKLPERIC